MPALIAKTIILYAIFFLIACNGNHYLSGLDPSNPKPIPVTQCKELIGITEQTIAQAGVLDSQDTRIHEFPYLRINRFLSSYQNEVQNHQFESWIDFLQDSGLLGWKIELKNLLPHQEIELQHLTSHLFPEHPTIESKLRHCSKSLRHFDLNDKINRKKIIHNATVPSEYNTWKQILGLYPLTAPAFRLGIFNWHQQTLKTFRTPLSSLPVSGQLVLYSAQKTTKASGQELIARVLKKSIQNPLLIPMPSKRQQKILFEHFAPEFEIDTVSKNDRIGTPQWNDNGNISINTQKAVVYHHISHTRMGSKALLQLNYIIWFPSRPKTSKLDLLSGHLDGIIWRVTLNSEGIPIIFDSIHTCGCYHFFFPTQFSRLLTESSLLKEPAFMPQNKLIYNPDQTTVMRINANNHYIQRVYQTPAISKQIQYYPLANADNLRSLALRTGQYRSLYNQEGFIVGTERGERYLFWPMGISNPGAMRQWGHHATAFVGRRHFDDARLFEDIIEPIHIDNQSGLQ